MNEHYIKHRNAIGYPYPNNGLVPVDPVTLGLDNTSIVFLSVGGNDVILEGNLDPINILQMIKAISEIYINAGAHVVYIIPYPPTKDMINTIPVIRILYSYLVSAVKESGLAYLSLEDFDDSLRKEPIVPYNTGIPEPTKKGSKLLAEMITNYCLKLKRKNSNCEL